MKKKGLDTERQGQVYHLPKQNIKSPAEVAEPIPAWRMMLELNTTPDHVLLLSRVKY